MGRSEGRPLKRNISMCQSDMQISCITVRIFDFREGEFEFVLLGKIQSDKIEGRFGKYRQMVGGNLYASVRQFVEADRTIKMLNLSKMNFAICDVKEMFAEPADTQKKAAEQILDVLLNENYLDLSPVPPLADQNSLFYISGCFARSLS
jgi:hypothetical protein